jgi:aspartyl-tRNA(Asn)/glutamyl-tRNA(Gln) amidotransferase subunit A
MRDSARRDAEAADHDLARGIDRGPLHGVPISIKDLFDVEGSPTTAASRVRGRAVADSDAPAIQRLRDAGAVIVGKTNLHEFAFGTTNEDSAYGPARNPYDPSRSPGGSSGGSAASVAAGMALATLGTDTGGSIRIPAAACGIVGLKPTYGEVSVRGVVPLSQTLDHAGPLANTVADVWTIHDLLTRRRNSSEQIARTPADLRVAVPRRYFCDLLDSAVSERFEASLDALRAAGATVETCDILSAPLIAPAYLHLVLGDAAAYHADTLDSMPERYTEPVRLRLEMARYVQAEDYVRALLMRAQLQQQVDQSLTGFDVLALPTLPIPAPALGATTVTIADAPHPIRNLMLRLTQLFNLTGHPAISLPCGRTGAGLPCGLQLAGRRHETQALLSVALGVEAVVSTT